VELVGRWWNKRWRHGRRDIWLYREGGGQEPAGLDGGDLGSASNRQGETWVVRAREGGDGGRELSWPAFDREWQARAWVDRLIAASVGQRTDWKDMMRLIGREPPTR